MFRNIDGITAAYTPFVTISATDHCAVRDPNNTDNIADAETANNNVRTANTAANHNATHTTNTADATDAPYATGAAARN